MIYSKTCEYAIRALKDLAAAQGAGPVAIEAVNRRTGVPRAYLSKIFQCLVRSGILASKAGPGGGYTLRIHPAKLTLCRIIGALDDAAGSPLSNCVMGQASCSDRNPCSLHPIWVEARDKMTAALKRETVANILSTRGGVYAKRRRGRLSKRMKQVFAGRRS